MKSVQAMMRDQTNPEDLDLSFETTDESESYPMYGTSKLMH